MTFPSYLILLYLDLRAKNYKVNIKRENFLQRFFMNYYSDTYSKHDLYSDTDSENLHIILSNQWFSLIVIEVSQRVASRQFIDEKASLQKFVILSIIRGNKSCKIKELIISESRYQCPRYSGTFIYTFLALTRV